MKSPKPNTTLAEIFLAETRKSRGCRAAISKNGSGLMRGQTGTLSVKHSEKCMMFHPDADWNIPAHIVRMDSIHCPLLGIYGA